MFVIFLLTLESAKTTYQTGTLIPNLEDAVNSTMVDVEAMEIISKLKLIVNRDVLNDLKLMLINDFHQVQKVACYRSLKEIVKNNKDVTTMTQIMDHVNSLFTLDAVVMITTLPVWMNVKIYVVMLKIFAH